MARLSSSLALPALLLAAADAASLPHAASSALARVFPVDDLASLEWEDRVSHHTKTANTAWAPLTLTEVKGVVEKGGSLFGSGQRMVDGFDIERHDGTSFTLHGADRRWIPIRKNCEILTTGFGCPCAASIWYTAANTPAGPPHFNKHDTFVQQALGSKNWAISIPPGTTAEVEAAGSNAMFMPRRDQAPNLTNEVVATVAARGARDKRAGAAAVGATRRSARPQGDPEPTETQGGDEEELFTTRVGDMLYVPRGVVQAVDTLGDGGASMHVSYYMQCAEQRMLWEELLHHVLHVRAGMADAPFGAAAPKFSCPAAAEWVLPSSGVMHLLIRALADTSPLLRGAAVGLVNDPEWVEFELHNTILTEVQQALSMLEITDVMRMGTEDPRLKAWLLAEAHTNPPDAASDPTLHKALLACAKDYLLDLVASRTHAKPARGARRTVDHTPFFNLFKTVFTDRAANKRAVQRFAALRQPHVKQHLAAAKAQLNQQHSFTKDSQAAPVGKRR